MTEKQYFEIIDKLKTELTVENADETLKQLDKLFEIKPVRLRYFTLKAQAMLKAGATVDTVLDFLNNTALYLYNYDGIEDISELYSEMNASYNDMADCKRNKLSPWINIGGVYQKYGDEIKNEYFLLEERKNKFLDDIESGEKLLELQESYFILENYVNYALVSYLLEKKNISFIQRNFIINSPNFGYLKEMVQSDKEHTFIIAVTDDDITDCEVAATILSLFGKKVFLLNKPLECQVESYIDMSATVEISLDSIQNCDGVTVITPVDIKLGENSIGDNRAELIDYILKNYTDDNFATVLCSGTLIDDLRERSLLQKQMQRLNNFRSPGTEKYLSFGWAGSYVAYMSIVYGFDVQSALDAPAECDFSIVIPARNSAQSLRHTLKTCLNQRYSGSYEIVISDNSINGDTAVYELCRELNDPRIKYYKTPRDLHLPKSFEFAFLKAKGRFIFSIGSDDAVLPWGLSIMDKVLKDNPDDEIILWNRAFYVWPEFNIGQQNQLIIPTNNRKNQIDCIRLNSLQILLDVINNEEYMYAMPMLYINSGFRRSYMKTLLNKTGYLWNGICQDVYIGVINLIINEKTLFVKYTLTIAGMTPNSEGFKSSQSTDNKKRADTLYQEVLKYNNIGGFSMSATERLLPQTGTDVSSLYNSILRAVTIGLLSRKDLENTVGWEKLFYNMLLKQRMDDIELDKKIHYFRYTASQHGEKFLRWFDDNIYKNIIQPYILDKDQKNENISYEEGFSDTQLTLDASKFGVENIYDAVKLFEKITAL